jgi:hypothetical protein
MVLFEPIDPGDESCYAAVQSYFVTLDCWKGIMKHLAGTAAKKDGRPARARHRSDRPSGAG